MITRIGPKAIELVTKSLQSGIGKSSGTMKKPEVITDTIELISQRVKNLKLFNTNDIRNHLFNFTKNGEIKINQRVYGSNDLQFLEHIKIGKYIKPKIYPEGTLPCAEQGIKQSNRLAKDIIAENEFLIDGYRYSGPKAEFDSFGKNISKFRSSNQEIVIIDRALDDTLVNTINAFKNRINAKNLTEEQKVSELMKFVDEVFSTNKSGEQISKYVEYMMKQQQVEVLLGDIVNSGAGLCRHRALLTKILADEMNIKCRMIQGYYNGYGHAWNEILTKNDTYLFDAMHGNIFNVSNTSRNVVPQVLPYRITNPKNSDKLIQKYFDENSTVGLIYRSLKYKAPIKTSEAILTPTVHGYRIEPLSKNVFVNGENIKGIKKLFSGDFVNLKDIGFEIV